MRRAQRWAMHLKSIRMGVPIHGDALTRATVRSGPHP